MKEWTIMVYMAGDNNLSEDMITGLKGMMSFAGRLDKINLIALYDSNYPPVPVKVYNFSSPKTSNDISRTEGVRKKRSKLDDFSIELREKRPASTTRPKQPGRADESFDFFKLKDFIPLVLSKFKAKRYALILSGHGDGVIGKALLRDESPSIVLDLKVLKTILKKASPVDENNKNQKFDILGFDSCLMNMLEVGVELKDVAKVMVASEGNIPSTGWIYEEVLAELVDKDGNMEAEEFAVSISRKYAEFNADYAVGGRSISISACDLRNIKPAQEAVYNLAQHLYDILNLPVVAGDDVSEEQAANNLIIREKFINWILLAHYESQTFMQNQAVDVLDFAYNLLIQILRSWLENQQIFGENHSGPVNEEIIRNGELIFRDYFEINQALNLDFPEKNKSRYILESRSIGTEYQFSTGVSLFFPWTDIALEMLFNKYSRLKFNDNDIWLKLIELRTNLTIRSPKENVFQKKANFLFSFDSVTFSELVHRQHGDRQHGDRQHGDRGSLQAFYKYFSQVRNYETEMNEEKPPKL